MFTEQQSKWLLRVEELFMRLGIKSLTMDDVSRELGISKKTLYQFVENKDDLVMKVIELHIQNDINECSMLFLNATDALDEIYKLMDFVSADLDRVKGNVMFDLQKYHNDAWQRMEEHQRGYIIEMMVNNLKRGISEGLYRQDIKVEITARLHAAQSFSLFNEHLFPRQQFPLALVFREYMSLFMYSIVSERGLQLLQEKINLLK